MELSKWKRGRLLEAGEPPPRGERFEELAKLRNVVVERIVSSAQPDTELYDQAQDEWVLLAQGTASLQIAGERVELHAGDYLLLPARTPHRVLATSAGAVWLAIHIHPS